MKYIPDGHTITHAEITIGDGAIMIAAATDQFKSGTGGCFVL
jgi:uncharacterized glyoxalase superfamily protein PhnB